MISRAIDNEAADVDLGSNPKAYKEADVMRDSSELQNMVNMYNSLAKANITYTFGDETVTLDGNTIKNWLQFDEKGQLIPFKEDEQVVHVLSYDEKPGIQAIANTTEDLLPDENHKTVSRDYEYKRLGTISLLAGIDLQTGEAIPLVKDKHSSKEYIEFLKILDSKYPETDRIRLVLDNLKVHSSEETRKYLATKPGRFEFVFTPKHGSWLNLVEGFFSKLTRQMLKGIRVKTKDELVQRIYRYFDEVNEQPVVYHWKYKLEEINSSEEVVVDTLPIQKSS